MMAVAQKSVDLYQSSDTCFFAVELLILFFLSCLFSPLSHFLMLLGSACSVTRGGKSTLCRHLRENYLPNAVVVEMDQYYWVCAAMCLFFSRNFKAKLWLSSVLQAGIRLGTCS